MKGFLLGAAAAAVLVGLGLGGYLLFLRTSPDPRTREEALVARVRYFWKLRINADWARIYQEIMEPRIQEHESLTDFVAGRGMIHYLAYEIHDVKIQGETAEVTCTVETKIDRKYVPGLRGSPYMEHVNRDRWVRIDGTWYRKYEDSREGEAAPGATPHRG